jgi:hypothetical protein
MAIVESGREPRKKPQKRRAKRASFSCFYTKKSKKIVEQFFHIGYTSAIFEMENVRWNMLE